MKSKLTPAWLGPFLALFLTLAFPRAASAAEAAAELKDLSINGGVENGKARIVIEGLLGGLSAPREKLIYATSVQHIIAAEVDRLQHTFQVRFDLLQGQARELIVPLSGEGEIKSVQGDALQDWSVRQATNATRVLVLRPIPSTGSRPGVEVTVKAEQRVSLLGRPVPALILGSEQPALLSGYVRLEAAEGLQARAGALSGLAPVEVRYLPASMQRSGDANDAISQAFRFQNAPYSLSVGVSAADPEMHGVVLRNFELVGDMGDNTAAFTLSATVRVGRAGGGTLDLLWGAVGLTEGPVAGADSVAKTDAAEKNASPALTEAGQDPGWRILLRDGKFALKFDRGGDFPIRLRFHAAVAQIEGWRTVQFHVAPGVLQRVRLRGLGAETRFRADGAVHPERDGAEYRSVVPPDGAVNLSWQQAREEGEGRLFFATEMLAQVTVSPGLMSQAALVEFKAMQGELTHVTLALRGPGEVTRVQGDAVLGWSVEPVPNSQERRLHVQLNQPQKDRFAIQVETRTPLNAFPQTFDVLHLAPEGATRFAGYYRVVNDGAVRLEVTQASGLSQVAPEQFPETEVSRALLRSGGSQRFVYRFSGGGMGLRIRADQVLPELAVSEIVVYHVGETELTIDSEFEIEIRDAPLRELTLRIPKGFALARLTAAGMSDYTVRELPDQPDSEVRLLYGQPATGRQLIQARLERNRPQTAADWALPRLDVVRAKSVRGHVGVSADPGFRLTADRAQGLTELATAFFPKKLSGLQAAFRITETAWDGRVRIERQAHTVQADALHLFSIGEGVAYGSSVINYVVSGAPVATFRFELSREYFNVEFAGKDVRNWQATTNGYVVQLHTAVLGPYTLLVTYERPFKAQGESLVFTGARPLEVQSEQGHTLVTSAYQFQVQPVEISPGLLALEAGEVPPEYRLLFDAPILAAYRYTSRPFNLRLALSPLAQADSLSQVVDRALLTSRISKAGQVLTDVHYFVKSRGHPYLPLVLPPGVQLWAVSVNGVPVVPVTNATENLIPLPQRADANAVLQVELKLAGRSASPSRVSMQTPRTTAPILLTEWNVSPDPGQRLVFREGSLRPVRGDGDNSGFAQLGTLISSARGGEALLSFAGVFLLVLISAWAWRRTRREGVYRFSAQWQYGTLVGIGAFLIAVCAAVNVVSLARELSPAAASRALTFLAPVQQANGMLEVTVGNVEERWSALRAMGLSWPALLAVGLWIYAALSTRAPRSVAVLLGWTALGWAVLRWPNSLFAFLALMTIFVLVRVLLPGLLGAARAPAAPAVTPPPAAQPASAAATALILCLGAGACSGISVSGAESDDRGRAPGPGLVSVADSVVQELRVTEGHVDGRVDLRWHARKGEVLPVLYDPAVLISAELPSNTVKLVRSTFAFRTGQYLLAGENGEFAVRGRYGVPVTSRKGESGLALPVARGLVNRLQITIVNADVEVTSPAAVAVERIMSGSNTVARLVLGPVEDAWIGWKPRSRDVREEQTVFYAEASQLYVPGPGLIEGVHHVQVRPAHGQVRELIFTAPSGLTITDVLGADVFEAAGKTNAPPVSPLVSLWRFDPDTRKLRVNLRAPQSRPFALVVRSQTPASPLPAEQSVGVLSVAEAAGQIGLVGVATGDEVQVENVTATGFSSINVEDFPPAALSLLSRSTPGLALRRAYRYLDLNGSVRWSASPVQPDIRVEAQNTLSVGEDRTVLAVNATVNVTRAGIFRLSFTLPTGFDVESITGESLSHWTELKNGAERILTLHLRGKTEGKQSFAISLAGAGIKTARGWAVPNLAIREASKQQGTLVVVPEQGIRFQVATRENVTQLDPQKSGIQQKGVLAFRLLQAAWALTLDAEQVDPWIQVTGLQHATVNEATLKVAANLQYQIENAGIKELRVYLPTNADTVQFHGEQVADFQPASGVTTNGLQRWDVKLHRRIVGSYLLRLTYQVGLAEQASEVTLRGIQAADVNLQRGFVTIQSGSRLELRIEAPSAALQAAEWQSIPRVLQQDLLAASANFAYRLVEPSFSLPLKLERRAAARLLPARVTGATLTSVIADDGAMLTHVHIDLLPGDKRLLRLTLPKEARFWFAFVNQNGVWPWREGDQVLVPLEQQSRSGQPTPLEFYYSSRAGTARGRALELELLAPKFDLPLENVAWRVYLDDRWEVRHWSGALQLDEKLTGSGRGSSDAGVYLERERSEQREKTKQAQDLLAFGNSALEQGDPQQARRAFQAAFGLSQGDQAFNEDARVQLNNVKIQQALVGLNVRQGAAAGESMVNRFRELRATNNIVNFTPQDARSLFARNSIDDNAAFSRLAERLVQQQDAALPSPAAIRASIPEQGQLLTFRRSVVVDTWADVGVRMSARSAQSSGGLFRALTLLAIGAAFGILAWATRGSGMGRSRPS